MNEINKYLEKAQYYLVDLNIAESSKILSEMTSEINTNPELMSQDVLSFVNAKRSEHGLERFVIKPKKSFGSFIMKSFGVFLLLIGLGVGFIYWKFTPLYEVDEENGRIALLGGFIELDAEAGKLKIADQYEFTEANYKNSFQAEFSGNVKNFIIKFNSGKFDFSQTSESRLKLDCKLSEPPKDNMIKNNVSSIKIDFSELEGSSCRVDVPRDINLRVEGEAGKLVIAYPSYHIDAKLTAGNIVFSPDDNESYIYDINVKNGYRGVFKQEDYLGDEYEVRINIENGSVHKN
jgi:hypothetical protein